MQCLEVNGAVRPLYGSLGVKALKAYLRHVSVQVCRFQGEQNPGLKKKSLSMITSYLLGSCLCRGSVVDVDLLHKEQPVQIFKTLWFKILLKHFL